MPALLTFFPQSEPSWTVVLSEDTSVVAGRDPECGLPLPDGRVSAHHARFHAGSDGFRIVDLQSKNGTFVNGLRITECDLRDEDWISFGGLPAHFLLASSDDIHRLKAEHESRARSSTEIRVVLEKELNARGLLSRLLESAISLAGAERGFVLVRSTGGTLHAAAESASATGRKPGFPGSRGAVEKVLQTGRPVVSSNAGTEAFLGKRPSVLEMGLAALACIPLHDGPRVIGVLYLDGKRTGAAFSSLDIEILETLADRAAILLASERLDIELRELADAALVAELETG